MPEKKPTIEMISFHSDSSFRAMINLKGLSNEWWLLSSKCPWQIVFDITHLLRARALNIVCHYTLNSVNLNLTYGVLNCGIEPLELDSF